MSDQRLSKSAVLGTDNQVDVVGVLRHALRRHYFDDAVLQVVPPPDRPERSAHFFEAVSFMEGDPQRLRELVTTLLSTASAAGIEIVLWLHGEPAGVRFRYAVVDSDDTPQRSSAGPDFQRMMEGLFPGVALRSLPTGPGEALTRDLFALRDCEAAGLIVGIPSEREGTPVETRLDDVLNVLAGRVFDVIVQAVPAPRRHVDVAEDNLAFLAGLAHQLTREQLSVSESDSFCLSVAEGVTTSWAQSETTTWSTAESKSTSQQVKGHGIGTAAGTVIGGLIGAAVGAPGAIAAGAQLGAIIGGSLGGAGASTAVPPVQETKSTSSSRGYSNSSQIGRGESSTGTQGVAQQWGRSVSVERLNRQAGIIGELAELHLARVRRMRSLGAWYTTVSVATQTSDDLRLTSSLLSGALRGDQSHLEPLRLIQGTSAAIASLLSHATSFRPVTAAAVPHPLLPGGEHPSTLLSSLELAHWFRPPSSPVIGTEVRPQVLMGAAVPHPRSNGPCLRLGPLVAGGRHVPQSPVQFAASDLLRHCFIAGTTGAGKTTTLRSLLLQLAEQGVPFLVVEPAKTEYRGLFDELVRRRLRPLRLSLRGGSCVDQRPLRLNPWRVPTGTVLGRHVDGMKLLLMSCFSMQESLPQILERAVYDMYALLGWNDMSSIVQSPAQHRFPVFADFVAPPTEKGAQTFLQRTVRSLDYRTEATGNLSAAITVRFQSFTRGLKGHLFAEEEGQFEEFLARPTFIELDDINEPDIRRFLLGALVLRLAGEVQARQRTSPGAGLRHVVVLEEAHHFLRETPGHGPGAELARESNILLADAFAEMRAYGEAIIVADQAPAELSPAVLRNTNLKISHRLLYEQDCLAMGDAMGLDDVQRRQLRALKPGECVVFGPAFGRAVQCLVNAAEDIG